MRLRYLKNVSTLRYDSKMCTGCGRCTEVCPHGVFATKDKKAFVVDPDLCMECGACRMNCAPGAIVVESGVGCAAALINGILTGGDPTCDCSPKGDGSASCC